MNDKLKLAVECKDMFYSILTNPDGLVVIEGSAEDRYILEQALSKLNDLVDLAESYLSIQGFPEKKCGKCYSSCSLCPYQKECPIDEKNKLIETMKLALLKKMDGIEDVVCNACNDCIDKTGGCAMLSNISKAIKDHLTK